MDNNNQQQFSRYTVLDSQPVTGNSAISKKFMAGVFLWMFIALGISTIMSIVFATNASLMGMMYAPTEKGAALTGLGMAISFAPIVFVLIMSFAFNKLSAPALTLFFLAYAAVMGMSLSVILLVYTSSSVIGCFGAASAMFGIMAFLGYTTEKDLTSFGRLLSMALIGILVSFIINYFLKSAMLDYLISVVGVAVFTGLTAYDVQVLKRIGAGIEYEGTSANDTKKLVIMGALRLYLDFINLFLMLLRLFGNRRN